MVFDAHRLDEDLTPAEPDCWMQHGARFRRFAWACCAATWSSWSGGLRDWPAISLGADRVPPSPYSM